MHEGSTMQIRAQMRRHSVDSPLRRAWTSVLALSVVVACGSSEKSGDGNASGGATADSGAAMGGNGSGGVSTGGTMSGSGSGGHTTGGTSTGGSGTATGGVGTSTGGTGGAATGGVGPATGGVDASTGGTGTGGAATGGVGPATGGVGPATGGVGTSTGGTGTGGAATGGVGPAAGGVGTGVGGATTGGVGEATGGVSTGGVASGGDGAGGASAGGVSENTGGTATGGTADPGSVVPIATDPNQRHLLLRDEGNSALHCVDLGDHANDWHADIPVGRDLQLVGDHRVLIGTETGYEERDIDTGASITQVSTFTGTIAARRLRNRNTLLVGVDWQGQSGIVLVEVNADAQVERTIAYSGYTYARLVRETPAGTFLITSDTKVLEGDADGNIVWQANIANSTEPHAWMGVRLSNGETAVTAGYAQSLQFFSADGTYLRSISGPASVTPFFYSGFQVLTSGNFLIANWQDHGEGHGNSGVQILEYDPAGTLVWSWQQDASYVSSLQGVILLDGLDLDKLYVEGDSGELVAVP